MPPTTRQPRQRRAWSRVLHLSSVMRVLRLVGLDEQLDVVAAP